MDKVGLYRQVFSVFLRSLVSQGNSPVRYARIAEIMVWINVKCLSY